MGVVGWSSDTKELLRYIQFMKTQRKSSSGHKSIAVVWLVNEGDDRPIHIFLSEESLYICWTHPNKFDETLIRLWTPWDENKYVQWATVEKRLRRLLEKEGVEVTKDIDGAVYLYISSGLISEFVELFCWDEGYAIDCSILDNSTIRVPMARLCHYLGFDAQQLMITKNGGHTNEFN